jgi:hypothetical protein
MNAKRQRQLDALKYALKHTPEQLTLTDFCLHDDAPVGQKHDDGKPRWDLLPYDAVAGVVDVLTHGSIKYGPENWRTVPLWDERYFAAAMRHLSAYRRGSFTDDDSGLPHLAHAACCVLFLLAKEGETR